MQRNVVVGLIIWVFLLIPDLSRSQEDFYSTSAVHEVRLYFDFPNWDYMLDSLFEADQQERVLATVCIDGTCMDSAGVRYKGYSSVNVDRVKNPLNIDLDYVIDGQEFMGVTKLKLGNVIHDPSFVREVLSYEIARKYMPASKANYANVFVNDTLIGLYTCVESINKPWADRNFGNGENAFFKGDPEVLEYPFGTNANLAYIDADSASYYPYYSIESDNGWSKLIEFTDILNNNTDNIESVLNVDRTLWMAAFDYALVNLDSYIAYSQNYYIYQDDYNRFNPVLWDMNMSFGSFRLSDGSTAAYTGGLTINGAKNLNPLGLLTLSVSPRPLFTKLLQKPTWKRMFMAHIRTIVEENFQTDWYYTRGEELQSVIDSYVQNDTNRFYSYSDFIKNLDSTVGGTPNMMEYPGIKDLVQARSTYLGNYAGFQGAPEFEDISVDPANPGATDWVWINAKITGHDSCFLAYRYNARGPFTKVLMYDDGIHQDGQSGDSIFGAHVQMNGSMFQYYFYAENAVAGIFSPQKAEFDCYSISPLTSSNNLVINELMADNETYIIDTYHEYDDWIELYNNSNSDISLSGAYLSDNILALKKWAFPDTVIGAHNYLIIWADDDVNQAGLHASFKLSASGESVYLTYAGVTMIDSVTFGPQITDWTWGRYPNGTGQFGFMHASYSTTNKPTSIEEVQTDNFFVVFPNPANDFVTCRWKSSGNASLEMFNMGGSLVFSGIAQTIEDGEMRINVSSYPSGVYFVKFYDGRNIAVKKLIIN
ncbi:MAG: CotH kinase family protein [Bacteroidetes bacterium]|nr:CotH kinase family protein [Bacteroidota bacterium]